MYTKDTRQATIQREETELDILQRQTNNALKKDYKRRLATIRRI